MATKLRKACEEVMDQRDEVVRLAQQRNDLLAACENMVHEHEHAQTDEEIENAVSQLRAAIAAARQGGGE